MMTKEEFLFLYEKNLSGQCTPEEKEMLESYSDDIVMPDAQWEPHLGNKEQLLHTLKANLQQSIPDQSSSRPARNYTWLKIAASILVVLTVGILWRSQQETVSKKPLYATAQTGKKILPGGNVAYLTMANGTVIKLNSQKNGKLATQTGVQINKIKDGVLAYNGESATDKNPVYNMINIPRGGQYQLVLADGTKVWLNSASSLKYPIAFYGKERKVELSGEAYFEVAKNPSKPFTVSVNGVSVQVLGTHFNIMAYDDEKDITTTLLEGSVKLLHHNQQALLKPGQQGTLHDQQTAFNVKNVDAEDAVAWKNGFFVFDDEDIQTIMKRISRWYDVDVVFPEKFKRKNFGGAVSRFKDVSEVLHSLELTGSVHFKTEGRRITVMP